MKGTCSSDGRCKVPGGVHNSYPCHHSKCRPTDKGAPCIIAPREDGDWVAKCPENLLPYDWSWPWVDPKKNKDKGD
jgi:hypothetical protein